MGIVPCKAEVSCLEGEISSAGREGMAGGTPHLGQEV